MSEYLCGIAGISVLSGVLFAVLPEGKTAKTVKAIVKLCSLLIVLSPVATYLKKGGDAEEIFSEFFGESVIQTDEAFIEYCNGLKVAEAEKATEKELFSLYGKEAKAEFIRRYVESEKTIGSVVYKEKKIFVERICIYGDFSSEEKEEIEKIMNEKYGCEAVVVDEKNER